MAQPTNRVATPEELEAAIDDVRQSPRDHGEVQLLLRRPGVSEREVLDRADFDTAIGLVGDNWFVRGSSLTTDGLAHPEKQVTIMNTRAVNAIAFGRDRWAFAGDQIYADLDVSHANLPAGTRLQVGTAVFEVTESPHLGCAKFTQRFGLDAHRWVNSEAGKELRLRGVNVRVVENGSAQLGDLITIVKG
ncbi:MAG TPA: hypothetical protein VMM60_03955 [Ilumatobacter sp.]|nr:hypothetical protein [Ilumatobacter sp.]